MPAACEDEKIFFEWKCRDIFKVRIQKLNLDYVVIKSTLEQQKINKPSIKPLHLTFISWIQWIFNYQKKWSESGI